MRCPASLWFSFLFLTCCLGISQAESSRTVPQPRLIRSFSDLPLGFEQNLGRADRDVLFLSRTAGYTVYLLRHGIKIVFDSSRTWPATPREIVNIHLIGAAQHAEPKAVDPLPGVINYYIGNDPAQWKTGIQQYRQVRYSKIYPGVDLVFYGNRGNLEFDFNVAPGVDPSGIVLQVDGGVVRKFRNNLELVTPSGRTAVLKRPDLYQFVRGVKRRVNGKYVLRQHDLIAFGVSRYDRNKALVIDPALIYSTLVGAPLELTGNAIAVDSAGSAYITGAVDSGNAFVLKLDSSGSTLVYRTLLGGTKAGQGPDNKTVASGQEIAVDAGGNAYFVGTTTQLDFPTTAGAFGASNFCVNKSGPVSCFEPFAAKLDSNGKLVFSTFLAPPSASDSAGPLPSSIAVDSAGALYVTGTVSRQNSSSSSPLTVAGLSTTPGAFQTARKNDSSAFVLKLHPDGSSLDYSTYLGGSTAETRGGIAVDSSGVTYVDGGTSSADFPVTPGASLTTNPGTATFFTKLKADGTGLLYSTFLAGPNGQSEGTSIAIDSTAAAYLAGISASTFPAPGFGNTSMPAFAAKFDASGTLVYSTLLGSQITYGLDLFFGTPPQSSIATDNSANAYVGTGSGGYSQSSITEIKVDPTGAVIYRLPVGAINPSNSRFGGVAVDSNQNFYVTGVAGSLEDPVIPPGGVAVLIPDIGTTLGAFQMLPAGGDLVDPEEVMFVQKWAQSLGAAVPVPNPRQVTFSPILEKGVTSSARRIQLFNYGDSALSVAGIGIGGTNPSDFAILTNNNSCTSPIAVQSSCSFQVTFTPTVDVGVRTGTVDLSFGGGISSQTVNLTGQAGTPIFQATPNLVDFGNVLQGVRSSIMTVTISNPGTGPLNLLATPFVQGANAGDFGTCVLVTGHCGSPFVWPAFIAANSTLSVPLAFTPSGSGPRRAQLVFQTDASGSPQSVQLQGSGVDLAVSAPFGISATVTAGQVASYSVVIATSINLSGMVTVACTGAPAGASCNPNPNTFSLGTGSTQEVSVRVPTTARSTASLHKMPKPTWWLAVALGIAVFSSGKRRMRQILLPIGLVLFISVLVSCGGSDKNGAASGSSNGTSSTGTPAGTYSLTVTASINGASSSLPLTLTVQ